MDSVLTHLEAAPGAPPVLYAIGCVEDALVAQATGCDVRTALTNAREACRVARMLSPCAPLDAAAKAAASATRPRLRLCCVTAASRP